MKDAGRRLSLALAVSTLVRLISGSIANGGGQTGTCCCLVKTTVGIARLEGRTFSVRLNPSVEKIAVILTYIYIYC